MNEKGEEAKLEPGLIKSLSPAARSKHEREVDLPAPGDPAVHHGASGQLRAGGPGHLPHTRQDPLQGLQQGQSTDQLIHGNYHHVSAEADHGIFLRKEGVRDVSIDTGNYYNLQYILYSTVDHQSSVAAIVFPTEWSNIKCRPLYIA